MPSIYSDNSQMWEEHQDIRPDQPTAAIMGEPELKAGLLQRARLVEVLASDIYGSQKALLQGWVPAALTLGHPGYLPALQGLQPATGLWLNWICFDIAMNANGDWMVLKQTTSPDANILRGMLESAPAPQATQWIQAITAATDLRSSEPCHQGVMLQQDAPALNIHPDWGLTSVHPQKLQIRGQQLWHIESNVSFRVMTLLNLLGHETIDPLEIKTEAHTGIAGLFDAMRLRTLSMVNLPGLGFLESVAWHGFWPALSRQLLQEELILPSIPSWWMGEREIQQQAFQNASQSIFLPAYPNDGLRPPQQAVHVNLQDPSQLQSWQSKLNAESENWVMQSPVALTHHRRLIVLMGPGGLSHILQTQAEKI